MVTACVPNLLPLCYWIQDRIVRFRHGENRNTAGTKRSTAFNGNRLPTCFENNLTLRPKEDDEIRLTTMATAARRSSEHEFCGTGIVVRSEVTQTVTTEDCRRVKSY